MLVVRRKANERIYLNDDIVIEVLSLNDNGTVSIGVLAPDDVTIVRGENYDNPENETLRSAASDFDTAELIARLERKRAEQRVLEPGVAHA